MAANHALSDCFAMGGRPSTAMATAVVPFASEEVMEEDLVQMMSGAVQVRIRMLYMWAFTGSTGDDSAVQVPL